jgi:hypothetical protein
MFDAGVPDPELRPVMVDLPGIAYGAPSYTNHLERPESARTEWGRVLSAVSANPALAPSASRVWVASTPDAETFAMVATAADRSQAALLVLNLQSEPATVTLDLTTRGISSGQTPIDLIDDGPAPAITGPVHSLDLPAYGYAIYQVDVT